MARENSAMVDLWSHAKDGGADMQWQSVMVKKRDICEGWGAWWWIARQRELGWLVIFSISTHPHSDAMEECL